MTKCNKAAHGVHEFMDEPYCYHSPLMTKKQIEAIKEVIAGLEHRSASCRLSQREAARRLWLILHPERTEHDVT